MCLLVNFLIRRENYIFLTRRRKPFKNFTEYLSCYLFNILTTLKIDATFVVCVYYVILHIVRSIPYRIDICMQK